MKRVVALRPVDGGTEIDADGILNALGVAILVVDSANTVVHVNIADEHFLIAMGDNEESDEFVGAGANLKQALRIDPVGKKVKEVLP